MLPSMAAPASAKTARKANIARPVPPASALFQARPMKWLTRTIPTATPLTITQRVASTSRKNFESFLVQVSLTREQPNRIAMYLRVLCCLRRLTFLIGGGSPLALASNDVSSPSPNRISGGL